MGRLAAGGIAAGACGGCVTSPDQLPPVHRPHKRELPCTCKAGIRHPGDTVSAAIERECIKTGKLDRVDYIAPPDVRVYNGRTGKEIKDLNKVKIGDAIIAKGPGSCEK